MYILPVEVNLVHMRGDGDVEAQGVIVHMAAANVPQFSRYSWKIQKEKNMNFLISKAVEFVYIV